MFTIEDRTFMNRTGPRPRVALLNGMRIQNRQEPGKPIATGSTWVLGSAKLMGNTSEKLALRSQLRVPLNQ